VRIKLLVTVFDLIFSYILVLGCLCAFADCFFIAYINKIKLHLKLLTAVYRYTNCQKNAHLNFSRL